MDMMSCNETGQVSSISTVLQVFNLTRRYYCKKTNQLLHHVGPFDTAGVLAQRLKGLSRQYIVGGIASKADIDCSE